MDLWEDFVEGSCMILLDRIDLVVFESDRCKFVEVIVVLEKDRKVELER